MARVTICVPAYRAEAFIVRTVRQALAQTHRDLRVEVGIEPPGDATLAACAPLAGDPRLRLAVNPRVLGWAGNVAALVARVDTPYFAILPHDLLHDRYVETLLSVLERDDAVSVAYGDIRFVAPVGSFRRALPLDEGPVADRLVSFFLGGGEAPPWRGVTRRSVLDRSRFPVDDFGGFLVECEWALHLVAEGVARRVPRTLYFKCVAADGIDTASRARMAMPPERKAAALEDHRVRLLGRIAQALAHEADRAVVGCAVDAALLRRHVSLGLGALAPHHRTRLADIEALAAAGLSRHAPRLLAMARLAQSQLALRAGESDAGLALAREAASLDPDRPEALRHLAGLLLAGGDALGALQLAARAGDLPSRHPGTSCESSRPGRDARKGGSNDQAVRIDRPAARVPVRRRCERGPRLRRRRRSRPPEARPGARGAGRAAESAPPTRTGSTGTFATRNHTVRRGVALPYPLRQRPVARADGHRGRWRRLRRAGVSPASPGRRRPPAPARSSCPNRRRRGTRPCRRGRRAGGGGEARSARPAST